MVPVRLTRGAAAGAGALLLTASPALAHAPDERLGDFWGGFLHPLTTVEHLPAILVLGILAGQQGPGLSRRALLVLPAAFAAGAVLASLGPVPAAVPVLDRLAFVVLGILAAGAWRLPSGPALAVIGVAGLGLGWENAAAVPAGRRLLFGTGGTAAVAFLFPLVAAGVVSLPAGWPRVAPRVVGSWIAAVGVLVLALGA